MGELEVIQQIFPCLYFVPNNMCVSVFKNLHPVLQGKEHGIIYDQHGTYCKLSQTNL